MTVTFDDVRAASERIRDHVHSTPVMTCQAVDDRLGLSAVFKCEGFQKAGAFKIRGAANAVLQLTDEEAAKGVVTHSSGNHAQALALAARQRGIEAFIVMPEDAPSVKRAAVEGYGATVVTCEPTLVARETEAARVQAETGATLIHAYDNERIIAGAGTVALDFLEEVPDLDALFAPVGGGGLLSGTCVAAQGVNPDVRIFAGEPLLADDAHRSFVTGRIQPPNPPTTVADGLRTALSERTFEVISAHVEEIVRVTEDAIVDWMRFLMERMKIVVEPSAATAVAALAQKREQLAGRRVGVILSGANISFDSLPWQ